MRLSIWVRNGKKSNRRANNRHRQSSSRSVLGTVGRVEFETAAKAAAKKIGVEMSPVKRGYIYGACEITDSTRETYDIIKRQFERFAYLVGDFLSLLVFSDFAPMNGIPPDIETCAASANFMCLWKGQKSKNLTKRHLSRKRMVACSNPVLHGRLPLVFKRFRP